MGGLVWSIRRMWSTCGTPLSEWLKAANHGPMSSCSHDCFRVLTIVFRDCLGNYSEVIGPSGTSSAQS